MEQKVQAEKMKLFFCTAKQPRLGFHRLAMRHAGKFCGAASGQLSPAGSLRACENAIRRKVIRRFTMQTLDKDLETELQLDEWFEAPTHEAAVEMMQADAVVPFGTAMWPV
ncbi:hypothetical protein [Pseudomonas citri]|uniref:hypothetical protein n=1 Tax=Pseudomonas citri TaxID=2978349 RepID=UPI0021B5E95A|nr:hypothetical protein [Pseudomonas citri]